MCSRLPRHARKPHRDGRRDEVGLRAKPAREADRSRRGGAATRSDRRRFIFKKGDKEVEDIAKAYPQLSAEERFQLFMQAVARDDGQEQDRLNNTCPQKTYRCDDLGYTRRKMLTPRQHSTGGKQRLGAMTKHGDVYLRTLLIHGTRAVLRIIPKRTDAKSRWIERLRHRRPDNVAAVALAAKHALLAHHQDYLPALITTPCPAWRLRRCRVDGKPVRPAPEEPGNPAGPLPRPSNE